MALKNQSKEGVGWRGGGGGTWCRQSKIIPKVYKRELPSQVRWMRQQGVLQ